ncbi:hypothetical protein PV338_35950, partial [Streptomyces scabiei]|nr:hypothetical protein [Streptomyces scabiei]
MEFAYEAQPMRVVMRPGAAVTAVAGEAERLGLRRLLVVCGPRGSETARAVADSLRGARAGLFTEARQHVPVEAVSYTQLTL